MPSAPKPLVAHANNQAPTAQHDTLGEIELRVGVEPLDELHEQLRALLPEFKAYWARYGAGGTWDAQRKAYRSAIAAELRQRYARAGEKISETRIEEESCADERYRKYLDNAEYERGQFSLLDVEMTMIREKINRGQGLLRYAAWEPR